MNHSCCMITKLLTLCLLLPLSNSILFDDVHSGSYNLGPVDFEETEWNNACSPYPDDIISLEEQPSVFLAGVSYTYGGDGSLCDACILVTTDTGYSVIARLITYGATNEEGDIDVSQQAYDVLNTAGEYPRSMTWQLSSCDPSSPGNIAYQFQTEANVYWTSLWVRNAWLPVEKVEVLSTNHEDWYELDRGTDGTLTDYGGFGEGNFTIRVTAINGEEVEDTFESFDAGDLLFSSSNFGGTGGTTKNGGGISPGGKAALVIFLLILPLGCAGAIVGWVVWRKHKNQPIIPDKAKELIGKVTHKSPSTGA